MTREEEPCLVCGAPINASGEGHDEGCPVAGEEQA